MSPTEKRQVFRRWRDSLRGWRGRLEDLFPDISLRGRFHRQQAINISIVCSTTIEISGELPTRWSAALSTQPWATEAYLRSHRLYTHCWLARWAEMTCWYSGTLGALDDEVYLETIWKAWDDMWLQILQPRTTHVVLISDHWAFGSGLLITLLSTPQSVAEAGSLEIEWDAWISKIHFKKHPSTYNA